MTKSEGVAIHPTPDGRKSPESFPLLDADGSETASLNSEALPFGILLQQHDRYESYCTLSHQTLREVTTSAHCLHSKDPNDYFAIHFDINGKKRVTPIRKILFEGSLEKVDVAVLLIDQSEGENWALVPRLEKASSQTRLDQLAIWSFDPFEYERGMKFAPKHCTGSRNQPQFWAIDAACYPEPLSRVDKNASNLVFYDQCDAHPIAGNSGALVTVSNSDGTLSAVGIHQKQIGPNELDASIYPTFDYLNTQGEHKYPTAEDAFDGGLYWAGIFLPDVKISEEHI